MKDTKPNRGIRCQVLLILLAAALWSHEPLQASPYHYAQVLPGVDRHHMMISSAAKDHSGIVWLVSGGLLYRYNGVDVVAFSRLYAQSLPFDEVNALSSDPWGRLWINSRNGLFVFDTNTWSFATQEPYVDELIGKPVMGLFNRGDAFFAATGDGKVWQIGVRTKKVLFHFDTRSVVDRKPVGRLFVVDSEHVWLAFGDMLYGLNLHTKKKHVVPFPGDMFNHVEDLLPIAGGVLVRVYSQGYYAFDGEAFHYLPRKVFPTNDFTNWNHWSFVKDEKVVVFHEDKYFEFSRDTAFTLLYEGTHVMDKNVLHKRLNGWQAGRDEWLLSTDHGLYSVFPAKVNFHFIDCGSARGMIKQGSTYYFGGYGYLDVLRKEGELQLYTDAPENNYYGFFEQSKDTAYIILEGDFLNYLINGKVSPAPIHIPPDTKERFSGMAYCVVSHSPDTLLVGTYNGIWKYARSSGHVYPFTCDKTGFFSRGMRVQSINWQGGDMTFTTDEGYYLWRATQLRKIYPTDQTKLNVYAHTWHGDSVYLATKGRGMVIVDRAGINHRVVNVESGLASNTVYQMIWIDDALFLGTHEGLSIFKESQLYNYHHTDGLPFEEFNHQAVFYDRDADQLYMGGTGGYIRFQPSTLLQVPDGYIGEPLLSGIRMGMRSNRYVDDYAGQRLGNVIRLPWDAVWFSMDFARPDYYRQVYRMQFKIEPLMDEYQDMPASAQINLSGMSAGEYYVSVKVQAINSGAVEKIQTWVIQKKPAFTETLAFYLLIILIISGLTGFILYERARKKKGEDRLRKRISRDLHDEVGGLLTGISMQTDLLRLKAGQSRSPSVESIGNYSREAIQMMDDIIWAVDSRNNQQGSLSDRMKFLASQLLEPLDMAVTFDVDQREDRKLSQTVRQNLYLIYKEAIHNICKHSGASAVYVKLHYTGNRIEMAIRDNGTGAHVSKQSSGRRGHGQRNMQLRAAQIGATFNAVHTVAGFEVSVKVPLHQGYFWNPFKYLN